MRIDPGLEREAADVAATLDRGRGFHREIRGAVAIPLPRKDFVLMPAACIHWPLTNKPMLKEWVERVIERDAYVFLVGDTFDFARSHYRRFQKTYQDDESSPEAIGGWHEADIRELGEILKPIKRRILGVVRGNHFHHFQDGTDSEQRLARILGVRYLGVEAAIRLDFARGESMVLYLHHDGGSGGTTMGGDVNGLLKAAGVINPDVVICAHTHKAYGFKEPQHEISRTGHPVILARDRAFLRSGCFKSTAEPTAPSSLTQYIPNYRAVKAYRPTQDGWVELEVEFRRGGRRLWVRS